MFPSVLLNAVAAHIICAAYALLLVLKMIENLRIDGFRSLNEVGLGSLGQFNVILGGGNSGKTNLLESLFLFCSNADPQLLLKVLNLRRFDLDRITTRELKSLVDWSWSVGQRSSFQIKGVWNGQSRTNSISRLDWDQPIAVAEEVPVQDGDSPAKGFQKPLATYQVETAVGQSRELGQLFLLTNTVNVKRPDIPNIPGRFISIFEQGMSRPLAKTWTQVEDRHEERVVLDLLRAFDAEIEDIRLVADEIGRASLRVQHKALGRAPVEFFGAGLGKALAIACQVVAAEGGILLVDEFDGSLDVGGQTRVVDFTMKAAQRHNVQLFASTHSLETLDAFLDCFANAANLWSGPNDLRILQLARIEGKTTVNNLSTEKAKRLREDLGVDLRRTA